MPIRCYHRPLWAPIVKKWMTSDIQNWKIVIFRKNNFPIQEYLNSFKCIIRKIVSLYCPSADKITLSPPIREDGEK